MLSANIRHAISQKGLSRALDHDEMLNSRNVYGSFSDGPGDRRGPMSDVFRCEGRAHYVICLSV